MKQYEMELVDAANRLAGNGRSTSDFSFQMSYVAPDPDGAGMFTVEYEVTILNNKTSKSLIVIGGIGHNWVDLFESHLKDGYFD